MSQKKRNPLRRRILRQIRDSAGKYLAISLFLILTIGFVSGMYVANGSMMGALAERREKYLMEDGHFALRHRASAKDLADIASGKQPDVRGYLQKKAQKELEERFDEEFDRQYQKTLRRQLREAGLTGVQGESLGQLLFIASNYSGIYQRAYDSAKQQAQEKVSEQVEKTWARTRKRYSLDDPDLPKVSVDLYENFCREVKEDSDGDGRAEGTIRIFRQSANVNLPDVLQGRLPERASEIAIDRMHADNAGIRVGDRIRADKVSYRVVGLISRPDYTTLHQKASDFMFDALKFDVAVVTTKGFARLKAPVQYVYSWRYKKAPGSEARQKKLSTSLLSSLLCVSLVSDNELTDYLPEYENPAIHFAPDDMGSDEAMGGVLLDVLTAIIAFIFAITLTSTITRDSSVIGTLRASGYTRRELLSHYLCAPVLITLLSAAIGNLLGYTLFTRVVVSMYYNSYSLPSYRTLWSAEAFWKTTLIPVLIMASVNLLILWRMLRHTPLQFLRHDLSRRKSRRALPLPWKSFPVRWRFRIALQNLPGYAVLFVGILFVMLLLAMAIGMPQTLAAYQSSAANHLPARYQVLLTDWQDEDGKTVRTSAAGAERFDYRELVLRAGRINESVAVYGISPSGEHPGIRGLSSLGRREVLLSQDYHEKYGVDVGDRITLHDRYESVSYAFTVRGITDRFSGLCVVLPRSSFARVFDTEKGAFSGFLSDTKITDLPEKQIAAVITRRDITKVADQLDHSMGAYMRYFEVLCLLLSAVLIGLLTRLIIERDERAISMTRILGYESREIASLYLVPTTILVALFGVICAFLGGWLMRFLWRQVMLDYSGWLGFSMAPSGYLQMIVSVLAGYLVVMLLDVRRIRKIPMDLALKSAE